ncbi:hypothetical protein Q6D67_04815 [Haliea sp. E1-2-M8]|uniref:hypothetical protein n=1 Tax=Haliea sp. E1-2-M8 TaxID=3064706 RepID=UPI0027187E1F|nr:hypothetical protein [Haliea sp. E1-2-M8]MDO8861017.1 hypothetical protein [Haliea sp. E1-2-M8]
MLYRSNRFFLAILAMLLAQNVSAAEVLVNGGFESGDFTGWSVTANGASSCDSDWTVVTTNSICSSVSDPAPAEGVYQAANSFDGNGPQEFRLVQAVSVPSGVQAATLSWQQQYRVSNGGTEPRTFEVLITDAADSATLATIDSQSFTGSTNSGGWDTISFDISSALAPLAGQSVNIVFRNFIPEAFTGPGNFALDDVSLDITAAEPAPVPVPLLPVWALLLLGALVTGVAGRHSRRIRNPR